MRLDKFVSQGTGLPRSHAFTMVRSGQVTVNGVEQRDAGAQVVAGQDQIVCRGEAVRTKGHLLLMLHKPAGYVTTTEEGATPIVMDLIPKELQHRDLAPIGRLDKDTTGLLLLTTDGGLNHQLSHPRRHVEKAYVAELDADLAANAEAQFTTGVVLADGTVCKPATLERIEAKRVRILLREGRYHQVKRMVAACGATVLRLHRERIGGLLLPADLAEGAVREVTAAELTALGLPTPT